MKGQNSPSLYLVVLINLQIKEFQWGKEKKTGNAFVEYNYYNCIQYQFYCLNPHHPLNIHTCNRTEKLQEALSKLMQFELLPPPFSPLPQDRN